jgi:hypothetical protein
LEEVSHVGWFLVPLGNWIAVNAVQQSNLNKNENKNMTTLHLRKSIGRSPLQRGFLLLALACFALSPTARAVSPAPDGGYSNANTAEGTDALFSLTTGTGNTAIGFETLHANTTSGYNTAIGFHALFNNTSTSNQSGQFNTATGYQALFSNTTGGGNTAVGIGSLFYNTTGNENSAVGNEALSNNTSGSYNTGTGINALSTTRTATKTPPTDLLRWGQT